MTAATIMSWQEANQRYSLAALAEVRSAIQRLIAPNEEVEAEAPEEPLDINNPALETLCRAFELSTFERKTLLMCAGVEWDSRFAAVCARAQGNPQHPGPTFSLAMAAFEDAHWSALS